MKDEVLTEEHRELLAFANGGAKHCTTLSGSDYRYTKPSSERAKKKYSRKVKMWGYGRKYKETIRGGTNGDKRV